MRCVPNHAIKECPVLRSRRLLGESFYFMVYVSHDSNLYEYCAIHVYSFLVGLFCRLLASDERTNSNTGLILELFLAALSPFGLLVIGAFD